MHLSYQWSHYGKDSGTCVGVTEHGGGEHGWYQFHETYVIQVES